MYSSTFKMFFVEFFAKFFVKLFMKLFVKFFVELFVKLFVEFFIKLFMKFFCGILCEVLWDVCMFFLFTVGRTEAYSSLVERRPQGSLVSPVNLFSIVTHIFWVVAFQVGAYVFLINQPW